MKAGGQVRLTLGERKEHHSGRFGLEYRFQNTSCQMIGSTDAGSIKLSEADYAQCAQIALDNISKGFGHLPVNYSTSRRDVGESTFDQGTVKTPVYFTVTWKGYPIDYLYGVCKRNVIYFYGQKLDSIKFSCKPEFWANSLKGKDLPKGEIIDSNDAWNAAKSFVLQEFFKDEEVKDVEVVRREISEPIVNLDLQRDKTIELRYGVSMRVKNYPYYVEVEAFTGMPVECQGPEIP